MTMPIDLVLVRHGESEGNVIKKRAEQGDISGFTEEYRARHSSKLRLSDRGIAQAEAAGQWLKDNGFPRFDRYYVSEYLRAKETAGRLDLDLAPSQGWFVDFALRERDYGLWDAMPYEERLERFGDHERHKTRDGKYWAPPGGESIAEVALRFGRILDTLHRECSDKRVVIVSHGELMWAARLRLERMSDERFQELDASTEPADRIRNCQVIHYTRRDPVTQLLERRYGWMRSVCPWDPNPKADGWQEIVRPAYGNRELLEHVARYPRQVSG